MLYAARANLLTHADEAFLVELTDDLNTGAAVEARLTEALTFASGEIDSALISGGIALPTATTAQLTGLCCLLALRALSGRRRLIKPGTVVADAWKRAQETLDKIAEGKLTPAGLGIVKRGGMAVDAEEVTDRETLENLL